LGAGAPATATTTTGATKKTLGNHNRIKSNKMRENSAFAKGNNNYTFINRHALETLYQLKVNAKKERGRERDSAQFHQLAHNFFVCVLSSCWPFFVFVVIAAHRRHCCTFLQ